MYPGDLIINKRGKQPDHDRLNRLHPLIQIGYDRQTGNFVSF